MKALRTTLWLATVALGSSSKGEFFTANINKLHKAGSLPGLMFGKLKLDLGKDFLMRGMNSDKDDVGFGIRIRVPKYASLLSKDDSVVEAGFAVNHKVRYVPEQGWQRLPKRHQVRSNFVHNFKNKLTTFESKLTLFGAHAKVSANSRGDFSFSELGFGYHWKEPENKRNWKPENNGHVRKGTENMLFAEGRIVAGDVLERIDKGRVIPGRNQIWSGAGNASVQGKFQGWGMTAVLSQPFKPIMPSIMCKSNHEVARGRFVASRSYFGPDEKYKETGKWEGIKSYAQVEYEDFRVDTGWQGSWVATWYQPLTKPFFPKFLIKRRWQFNDGFFTDQYVGPTTLPDPDAPRWQERQFQSARDPHAPGFL